jgi:hypothetical protein
MTNSPPLIPVYPPRSPAQRQIGRLFLYGAGLSHEGRRHQRLLSVAEQLCLLCGDYKPRGRTSQAFLAQCQPDTRFWVVPELLWLPAGQVREHQAIWRLVVLRVYDAARLHQPMQPQDFAVSCQPRNPKGDEETMAWPLLTQGTGLQSHVAACTMRGSSPLDISP